MGRKALEPVIEHMKTCCPEKLLENKDKGKLLEKCRLGCKNCQVPGELERKERERVEKSTEGQYLSNAFAMRAELSAITGIHNPFAHLDFQGCRQDLDYYDEFEFDDTPVDFLRPDGDIEGKDVQWCLDNDFFQIHDGVYPLWSGPWYYRDRPEERPMPNSVFKRRKQYEDETGAFTNLVDILLIRSRKYQRNGNRGGIVY
jgi:hypothetical protein